MNRVCIDMTEEQYYAILSTLELVVGDLDLCLASRYALEDISILLNESSFTYDKEE